METSEENSNVGSSQGSDPHIGKHFGDHLIGAVGLSVGALMAASVGIVWDIRLADAACLHLFSLSLWFWLQWVQTRDDLGLVGEPAMRDGRMDALYAWGGALLAVFLASSYLLVANCFAFFLPQDVAWSMIAAPFIMLGLVWLFLSQMVGSPKGGALDKDYGRTLLHEAEWGSFLVAGGIFAGAFGKAVAQGITCAILLWVTVSSFEVLMQSTLFLWRQHTQKPMDRDTDFRSKLRTLFFSGANPFETLLTAIDRRAGSATKEAWVVQVMRRYFLPMVLLTCVAGWLLSSCRVVTMLDMALEERFGVIIKEPLGADIHFVLPWPFGRLLRFPVKQITTMTVGFAAHEADFLDKPILWTKAHVGEEFALVLGNGAELVVVNALLYYKIAETEDGLMQYAMHWQNSLEALNAMAYRTLMEETRVKSLDEVLTEDRARFTRGIERRLRDYVKKAGLGIEVVGFDLLSLHPPVPVAASYLDVINARLEARRAVIEARGEAMVAEQKAAADSLSLGASATADSLKMRSTAAAELAQFQFLASASRSCGEVLRTRLWLESGEQALMNRPLIIVDPSFAQSHSEIWLDLRSPEASRTVLKADAASGTPGAGPMSIKNLSGKGGL